jgi:hypothetical protein
MSDKDTGFKLDFADFDKKFLEFAIREVPGATQKGLYAAIERLHKDANQEAPKTPHREGHLRDDVAFDLKTQGDSIISELTFKMPYAARWHEAEGDIDPVTGSHITWSEKADGVGPKYVETKLIRNMKRYIGIVTDFIEAEMAKRLGAAK